MELKSDFKNSDRRRAAPRRGILFYLWQLVRGMWHAVTISRRIVTNLIFVFLIAVLIGLFFQWGTPSVPENAALVFAPNGRIVDQFSQPNEMLLRDIIDGIDHAAQNPDITVLFMDLDGLQAVNVSKLQEIAKALMRFRQGQKTIIASGSHFTQTQYYLAAHADRIYLHPMGRVWLSGYGVYRHYFKNALDRLKLKLNVFRIGTYKSALEPFIRNEMSEAAREANSAWLDVLWTVYKSDISGQRQLRPALIDDYVAGYADHLAEHGGSPAKTALSFGLVDGLRTRDQVHREMIQLVGKDKESESFKQVRFADYLDIVNPEMHRSENSQNRVGVIIAQGLITGGKQAAGRIGADSLSNLIRRSREKERIKALVVRVNSGGGSALASEIIRREIELTRQAGIPVVVSMGAVAASGGYWMSASADEIWALPTTLTGSIGIFSAFPTLNEALAALGVFRDGIGTTPLTDAYDPFRPLNPLLAESMQISIENGYRRFIRVVSQGRQMAPSAVEKIAEGRVWDGKKAYELGLVDGLGGLASAVKAAARLADVSDYDVVYLEPPMSPAQRLLKKIRRSIDFTEVFGAPRHARLNQLVQRLESDLAGVDIFNDPLGLYALCPICRIE